MLLRRPQQQQALEVTGGAHIFQNRPLLYSGLTPGMFADKGTEGTTQHNNVQLTRSQRTPAKLIVVVVSTLNIRPSNHERGTPRPLENDTVPTQIKDDDKSSRTGPP